MAGRQVTNVSRRSKQGAFHKAASDAIADRMEAIASEVRGISNSELAILASSDTLCAVAFTLQQTRRKIDEIFEYDGFAVSPACDVMLELFQARVRGNSISISALCHAIACPPTVARRWVDALESMLLLEKLSAGKNDFKVALSEKGFFKTAEALQLHL